VSKSAAPPKVGKKAQRRIEQLRKKRRQKIMLWLAVITTLCAVVIAIKVVPYMSDLISFKKEKLSPFDSEYLEINSDYVGWLKIDNTSIDFPVVRGLDNEKYLKTTFRGENNILGSIFMDYRCIGNNLQHMIIYGHQAGDTATNKKLMFGELTDFLDKQYLAEHPIIMYLENDTIFEFEIFSARMSDTNDPAFYLDFSTQDSFPAFLKRNNAPADATKIITLSTCVGANNDRRMIVQGVLKNAVTVKPEYGENGWNMVRQN